MGHSNLKSMLLEKFSGIIQVKVLTIMGFITFLNVSKFGDLRRR